MSKISARAFDLVSNKPAPGIQVLLELLGTDGWQELGQGVTSDGGKANDLLPDSEALQDAVYRLSFFVKSYMKDTNQAVQYPYLPVVFSVDSKRASYAISVMLSESAYSVDISST